MVRDMVWESQLMPSEFVKRIGSIDSIKYANHKRHYGAVI